MHSLREWVADCFSFSGRDLPADIPKAAQPLGGLGALSLSKRRRRTPKRKRFGEAHSLARSFLMMECGAAVSGGGETILQT
jgi:hypothetical protein